MPVTGERCKDAGLYRSVCADEIETEFAEGASFPTCRVHGVTRWVLLRLEGSD